MSNPDEDTTFSRDAEPGDSGSAARDITSRDAAAEAEGQGGGQASESMPTGMGAAAGGGNLEQADASPEDDSTDEYAPFGDRRAPGSDGAGGNVAGGQVRGPDEDDPGIAGVVPDGTAIDHVGDASAPGEEGLGNAGDTVADDER